MSSSAGKRFAAVGLAAVLVGSTACASKTARFDKAGSVRPTATKITLESPDGDDPGLLFFAKDATQRSHGSLDVVIDLTSYLGQIPADDLRLVADLRAGRRAFSYQAARDWAAAGVSTFRALDAPFLVSNTAAAQSLAVSPLASVVLGGLSTVGMVGIGLIPDQPRHIDSVVPLLSLSDFHRIRLRINDNPETAAMVTAMGAVPVQGLTAQQTSADLLTGALNATEASDLNIVDNNYNAEAPYVTSYAPILKFETVSATKAAWTALTAGQQATLHQAVADTVAYAAQVPERDDADLTTLCASGVVMDEPSVAQLAAIGDAAMAADPQEPAAAALIKRIRATIPGAGPQQLAEPLPASCAVAHTAAAAAAARTNTSVAAATTAVSQPGFPTGTYVTTDTVADFRAAGFDGPENQKPLTATTTFFPDGRVTGFQQPSFPDNNNVSGRWVVHGDLLTITWDPYMLLAPETVRWSYLAGRLTFHLVDVQDSGSKIFYTAHPWRKIG